MLKSLATTVVTPSEVLGAARGALERLGEPRDADGGREPRRGRPPRAAGAKRRSTPLAGGQRGVAGLVARVGGEVLAGPNCAGLTNSETTTTSQALARAADQREVALVQGAHRRDQPDPRAPRGGPASAARSSATVRTVLMRATSAARELARGLGERVEEVRAARARARRRRRAGAPPSPRRRGRPGRSAPARARAPPSSRRSRGRAAPAARLDAGGRGQALGGGLQRDEEVRGDRGGGVVGGAVLVGDLDGAPCPSAGQGEGVGGRARGRRARDGAARAGEVRARRRARSSAGAARTPRGRRAPRAAVAPEQWPTSGPGRDGARRRRRSRRRGRTGAGRRRRRRRLAPRPSGPSTPQARRRRAAASAVPRRPAADDAQERQARGEVGGSVPVPAWEIPVGAWCRNLEKPGPLRAKASTAVVE